MGRGAAGFRFRRQPAREASGVVRALRAVTAERLDARRKIDSVPAKPAFNQDNGKFARGRRFAAARGVDHHAREARR
jgi:hypothetical protein